MDRYWVHEKRVQIVRLRAGILEQGRLAGDDGSPPGWYDASNLLERVFTDPDYIEVSADVAEEIANLHGVPWS